MPERELGQETVPIGQHVPSDPGGPSVPVDSNALVGRTLGGRFRLLRFLGRGGMGEVYEARDLVLQTIVAVKTLSAALAGDASALDRLRREVLLARRVAHPNVCRIHELHQDLDGPDSLTFISMEYLEGETLAERLQRGGAIPVREALALLEQLGEGLGALHREGLVHRDFKPGNVMLVRTPEGQRAVVMDFGIARPVNPEEGSGPTVTASLGTPRYMAPEQLRGGELGPRTDVYAFALVAQEMVTGAPPGVEAPAGLSGRWTRALQRATAVAPSRRFESAAALVRALHLPRIGWRGAAVVAALLLATGAVAWAVRHPGTVARSRRPAVAPANVQRVAILPVAAAPDGDSLALADALRSELSLPGEVRSTTESETWAALHEAPPDSVGAPPRELLQKLLDDSGAELALLVAVRTGSDGTLQAQLGLHRTSGEQISAEELNGRADDFRSFATEVGRRARALLGVAEASSGERGPLEATHPRTLATAIAHARGRSLLAAWNGSAALPLFEQVVQAEPDLASGLADHAAALALTGRTTAATAALARAAHAAGSLPEPLRLPIESRYWEAVGNEAERVRAIRRLAALFPEDPAYLHDGQPTFEELVRLRTSGYPWVLSPEADAREARAALREGKAPAVLSAVERGEQKLAGFEDRLRWLALFAEVKASALQLDGRIEEALRVQRSAAAIATAERQTFRLAGLLFQSAETLHDLRQWSAAAAAAREARSTWTASGADLDASTDVQLTCAVADNLLHLGDLSAARSTLDELERRWPRSATDAPQFLAARLELLIALGRMDDAAAVGALISRVASRTEGGQRALFLHSYELGDIGGMEQLLKERSAPAATSSPRALEALDADALRLVDARMDALPPVSWASIELPRMRGHGPGTRSASARVGARLAVARGDLARASSLAQEALAEALKAPDAELETAARLEMGRVRLASGDRAGADETLAPLDARARQGNRRLELETALVRLEALAPRNRQPPALRLERRAAQLGFRRIAARAARVAGT